MNTERLTLLYGLIDGLHESNINMIAWRTNGTNAVITDDELIEAAKSHDCGTTACALGWAAAYPPFKTMGLSYRDREFYVGEQHFSGDGYEAAAVFFDICHGTALDLFGPVDSRERSEKHVFLDRLRYLLESVS